MLLKMHWSEFRHTSTHFPIKIVFIYHDFRLKSGVQPFSGPVLCVHKWLFMKGSSYMECSVFPDWLWKRTWVDCQEKAERCIITPEANWLLYWPLCQIHHCPQGSVSTAALVLKGQWLDELSSPWSSQLIMGNITKINNKYSFNR